MAVEPGQRVADWARPEPAGEHAEHERDAAQRLRLVLGTLCVVEGLGGRIAAASHWQR